MKKEVFLVTRHSGVVEAVKTETDDVFRLSTGI